MNKADLIEALSLNPATEHLSKKDLGLVATTLFDTIAVALGQGEEVKLVGFGTFGTRQRKERIGRNPKTGQTMTIPASVLPFLKPGKELKQRVAA
jgi:nucleoid DNA-binding protein